MKLSTKLYLGFALVLLFAVVQGLWSYCEIQKNVGKHFSLADTYAPLGIEANALESAVLNAGYSNMRYFYTLSDAHFVDVDKFLNLMLDLEKKIATRVADSEELREHHLKDGTSITAIAKAITTNSHSYNNISREINIVAKQVVAAQKKLATANKKFIGDSGALLAAFDNCANSASKDPKALAQEAGKLRAVHTILWNVAEAQRLVLDFQANRYPAAYYEKNNLPPADKQAEALFGDAEKALGDLIRQATDNDKVAMLNKALETVKVLHHETLGIVTSVNQVIGLGAKRVGNYRTVLAEAANLAIFSNDLVQSEATTMINDLKSLESFSRTMLLMVLLQLVVSVICAYFITNSITGAIISISGELSCASAEIADAAANLTQGAVTLAQNVSEQGASVEQSSASLEEIASMTSQTSMDAADTARNVNETVSRIAQGAEEMKKMVTAMDEINSSAASIGNIISTIENIAFQTNLLALNAAVEAARAGEMGKGFAVVAEEVRSLAQRSATAAHETSDLITSTIDRIDNGVKISNEVETTFHAIESDTRKVDELVTRISSAMKEESIGIGQIKTAISQLESIAQGNSEISEQSARASTKMEEQSHSMAEMVRQLEIIINGVGAASRVASSGSNSGAPAPKAPKALLG